MSGLSKSIPTKLAVLLLVEYGILENTGSCSEFTVRYSHWDRDSLPFHNS